MSTYQVTQDLIAKTAFAAGINVLGSWGSRFINWNPQATLPAALSTTIHTIFEFIALKAQRLLETPTPHYHHLPRKHTKNVNERIHFVSAIAGAIAATLLTPLLSKRLGSHLTLRASATFTLSSLLFSYLTPPSKMRGR